MGHKLIKFNYRDYMNLFSTNYSSEKFIGFFYIKIYSFKASRVCVKITLNSDANFGSHLIIRLRTTNKLIFSFSLKFRASN
jgi:hypothetical protein